MFCIDCYIYIFLGPLCFNAFTLILHRTAGHCKRGVINPVYYYYYYYEHCNRINIVNLHRLYVFDISKQVETVSGGVATKLLFGERAFSAAGPTHWNNLPETLRTIHDPIDFKKRSKLIFFELLLILFCIDCFYRFYVF